MQKLPKVKICCISSQKEAQLAIKLGASVLGLVGPMPSGPGIINNHLIKQIAENTSGEVSTFLLTSETSAQNIIEHYKKVKTTTI
jgi:phosphoribosylanthranilate isomerase